MALDHMNRREFLAPAAAAAAFTIVPRHVLGGPGYVPPSDKLVLAHIGCGTEGTRELVTGLLQHPQVQIVAVCDPVKNGTNYVDWSKTGIRDTIRRVLDKPGWAEGVKGIRAGRDQFQEILQTYYAKQAGTENYKINSYADFRECLDKEKDIDAVKIMTPDHLHATIAIAAMNKKKAVAVHKPLSNRVSEARLLVETARKTGVPTHLLAWTSMTQVDAVKKMILDGAIGTLKEIHVWTDRPIWPQPTSYPADHPPVPEGMDYQLWLGPSLDRPYHPSFTHAVFRGWYEFGGGTLADTGNYTFWPMFYAFDLPVPTVIEANPGGSAAVDADGMSAINANDFAFPFSATVRFKFPAHGQWGPIWIYEYEGGIKPFTPEELLEEKRSLPAFGTMYVGDKGIILGNRLIPEQKMKAYAGDAYVPAGAGRGGRGPGGGRGTPTGRPVPLGGEDWIPWFKGGPPTPGVFTSAGNITEFLALGALALRYCRKNFRQSHTTGPLEYDPATMKITNFADANQFLYREYRKGWELPVA